MSVNWDNLFDNTGLKTSPDSPPATKPATVAVAPSAKTEPAPSDSPKKRARKPKAGAPATTAPAAPDSVVASDFFLGGDSQDDVGAAGATAETRSLFDESPEDLDTDDLFGEDAPTVEAVTTKRFDASAPTPAPLVSSDSIPEAKPKKAGRPKGAKSKPVTAADLDQAFAKLDAGGESMSDATFPVDAQSDVSQGTAEATGSFAKAFEYMVAEIVRRTLREQTVQK
jgi:hypothetical protein